MEFMKKLAVLVIIGYLFIEAGLLCGLFTNEWIKTKEYHLGLRRYCYNTRNDTSCHNVVDILPNLKYMLDTVFYISIGACSWVGLVFIVMVSSLRCNGCNGSKTRRCTSLVMFSWCLIQGAVLTIFMTAIMAELSASASDVGWSLYLECTTLVISYFLLTVQICCKDGSGKDSATVDVIDEILVDACSSKILSAIAVVGMKVFGFVIQVLIRYFPLSYSIENVLGDEHVIGGCAPMNHITHDPNVVYQ